MIGLMASFPKQVDGLEISSVEDGLVVNDNHRGKVHYLNHTAGLVLTLCDGRNSIETIAGLLQKQFDLSEPPEQDVHDAIDEFVEEEFVIFESN
jgi:Coenzyme PQQ synthesis protein D (PqqD)